MNKKTLSRLLLALLLFAFVFLNVSQAWADEGGGTMRKEVDVVMNKSYELFIGNGGVFLDNSRHIGTLVIKSIEPTRRAGMWHVFTQRLIDVRMYEKDGGTFTSVYGLVRVYFNLDKFQYDKWSDPQSNMSIWYFDEQNGGWHKCTTHWEPAPGLSRGRLWCLVHRFALYGLAYTQPTMIMKLIKQGVITVTPTP
jgi:hypothetical protein